jgi:hypothetical protein
MQVHAVLLNDSHDGSYWINSANALYWDSGGEPAGVWKGTAAELDGLNGLVQAFALRNLLFGLCPEGLTRRVKLPKGKTRFGEPRKRVNGIDSVVTATKPLTICDLFHRQ